MLFLQALLSSVKHVPVLSAWNTVKCLKKKRIVDGTMIGVLERLSPINLWGRKKKVSQKAVSLHLSVLLLQCYSLAFALKGHAKSIAAIQMAAIAVQCL